MTTGRIMRRLIGLTLGAVLCVGLVHAPAAAAQNPPSLSEAYTWADYNLSVNYPAGWAVDPSANAISLHPADRDISEGQGPEFVLFALPDMPADQIDTAITTYAAQYQARQEGVISGDFQGYPSRSFTFKTQDPAVAGSVMIVAANDTTLLGAAYIVRTSEAGLYLVTLEQMFDSLTLDASLAARGSTQSISVASVQLAQTYEWAAAHMTLYFPTGWAINTRTEDDIETVESIPPAGSAYPSAAISATTLDGVAGLDLHDVADAVIQDYDIITNIEDITLGGHPAVIFDIQDSSQEPTIHLRTVALALPEQDLIAVVLFSSTESDWDSFRPVASAFTSSIEPQNGTAVRHISPLITTSKAHGLASIVPPITVPALPQESDPNYTWEEYGVSLDLPENWVAIAEGSQDYDLALVSPDAAAGSTGAFMTFRYVSALGPDVTAEDALQQVAEQAGGEVTPYTAGDYSGYAVILNVEDQGLINSLILLPYDDQGAFFYIQAVAPTDQNDVIDSTLASMTIDPPMPDYAAVDAAWQTSLAENRTLIYGSEDAPVFMTEYLSMTCSHCADYSHTIEHLLALDVEGTQQVRLELAMLAGDDYALLATKATYCATEQGKGYSAYKALMHGYLNQGYDVAYTDDGIDSLLGDLELDMDALHTCIAGDSYDDVLNSVRVRFTDNGLTGTPTVMLGFNGEPQETIALPDGQIWSGSIPMSYLHMIFSRVLDDGVSLSEVFNQ